MHEPLKDCPFCGGAPTTIERPDNIDGTQFFYAIACYCGRHSACAHKMAVRKTPEIAKADAIAAWNTRATQPTQAQAGAVPLTDEQIVAAANEAFNTTVDLDDETLVNKYGHGVYISRFIDFARAIEAAHGIKGGQHGAE